MTTTVAAIDCGTNSIRLLIAHADPTTGALTDITRTMRIVRLGQDVDATGRLAPEAIDRTLTAVREYANLCNQHSVAPDNIRFTATSASRDAENATDFTTAVHDILGVKVEVIAGTEEAALSFAGATSGLPATDEPTLVVDIGGGSTEFVLGTNTVTAAISTNIGCVRLTERHLTRTPPTADQVFAAVKDIDAAIDEALTAVPIGDARALVGVAGSVTTITAHALNLTEYNSTAIHGAELGAPAVLAACAELTQMTRDQRLALGFMHPGRVDVIGAGAVVWAQVVRRVTELAPIDVVRTSEHDILDGIAMSVLHRQ